ncbi:hypothetical protein LTR28_005534 [Elasticomyces elasticus]|nr:hypothetical protein LTR28_005534 [Elasticomyces elasticus]
MAAINRTQPHYVREQISRILEIPARVRPLLEAHRAGWSMAAYLTGRLEYQTDLAAELRVIRFFLRFLRRALNAASNLWRVYGVSLPVIERVMGLRAGLHQVEREVQGAIRRQRRGQRRVVNGVAPRTDQSLLAKSKADWAMAQQYKTLLETPHGPMPALNDIEQADPSSVEPHDFWMKHRVAAARATLDAESSFFGGPHRPLQPKGRDARSRLGGRGRVMRW